MCCRALCQGRPVAAARGLPAPQPSSLPQHPDTAVRVPGCRGQGNQNQSWARVTIVLLRDNDDAKNVIEPQGPEKNEKYLDLDV